jgi:ABC-type antimicrobial peptide transport system permease subunit
LVATGATLGIGLTFGLSRVVRAGGGAGSVFDPPLSAFLVPIGVIVVIAVLATWLPARRAAAIDPVKMLRTT